MKIIAEAGANFDTVEQAFEMIEKSNEAGCAYTKFQLYDESVIKDSPLRRELQKRMITREFAKLLVEEGEADGQPVFFTPMFLEAVDWIEEMGCPFIKIRYSDRYNIELVSRALEVGVPVIISADHHYIMRWREPHTKLLYCVPRYPASPEDYKFTSLDFGKSVYPGGHHFSGISDHTKGMEILDRAKACGAELCEVHAMIEGTHPIDEAVSKTFEEVKAWVERS